MRESSCNSLKEVGKTDEADSQQEQRAREAEEVNSGSGEERGELVSLLMDGDACACLSGR